MAWSLLILALLALVLLHVWWQTRLARAKESFRRIAEELRSAHQLEIASRNSQERALLDSMVEGLLVLDEDNRIRLANRAFAGIFQISSDIIGRTLLEAVRLHELADLAESLGQKKQIEGFELKLPVTDERWVGVSGATLSTVERSRGGKLLVFHDLTRIKKLERTRQEFVANVSHELRTPLSLIKGYAETLLDGAKDNPELATRFLETIDRNAERLKFLIEDLLTLSELESGRISLHLQTLAADTLAAKVLADLASHAQARNVSLINRVTRLEMVADADRLEQVLVNLVDNGIKYGRVGGTVVISARPTEANEIEFSVVDDGPGISAEAVERVFERFYREDKARSREQGGTGLGLSIVKHIVQCHGGRVWARSQHGHGAAFYFTLPRAKPLPSPAPAAAPPRQASSGGSSSHQKTS